MKSRITMILGAAALVALLGPISAQAGGVHVGPGGVRIGGDRDHCRTIIDHRTNDRGDEVTVRRRVCD
ncbi:MAG TPA: hypothetical protein VKX28_02135 [Xanthobacteraceae bacterium]|nr:hypothetical protein [Xanthobacteraceae bacterium]